MVKSMNFFAFCSLDEEEVLCCEALCVARSGGALTLQQCSVPESCSLSLLSRRNGVTHEPTCTYIQCKHRVCWLRTIAFLFVVICSFTYNKSKKALSSHVPSCPVCLCSICLHTWPEPVDIFYLPPGQRLAIKSLADITMSDLFYACFPSRLHFLSMFTSLVDFSCAPFQHHKSCSIQASSYYFLHPELQISPPIAERCCYSSYDATKEQFLVCCSLLQSFHSKKIIM